MCPEAESYERLIVMNVGVVGGAHCTTMRRHGDGQTQTRSAADDVGPNYAFALAGEPSIYFRLPLIGYFEGTARAG